LRGVRKELRQKKRDVEQLERQSSDAALRESKILKQQSTIAKLHVQVQQARHSEEELAVMKRAMEEIAKARQDELQGVLIDSNDVKVESVIGKGGFGVVNLAVYKGRKVVRPPKPNMLNTSANH
jgi:hypothetical protein